MKLPRWQRLCSYAITCVTTCLVCRKRMITHVCVSGLQNWNPRSESRRWSCSYSHGLVAKPPTRNANCSRLTRSGVQGYQGIRTELVGRRCIKLTLIESTVDWIEGSKNVETCALCARKLWCQFVSRVSVSLPGQCQPPALDSTVGIVISQGAKFDVLILMTIRRRKDLLYPFVKFLGKRCQVLGGIES